MNILSDNMGVSNFQAAEAENMELPSTPAEATKSLTLLLEAEKLMLEEVREFNKTREEVDDLVTTLYVERVEMS